MNTELLSQPATQPDYLAGPVLEDPPWYCCQNCLVLVPFFLEHKDCVGAEYTISPGGPDRVDYGGLFDPELLEYLSPDICQEWGPNGEQCKSPIGPEQPARHQHYLRYHVYYCCRKCCNFVLQGHWSGRTCILADQSSKPVFTTTLQEGGAEAIHHVTLGQAESDVRAASIGDAAAAAATDVVRDGRTTQMPGCNTWEQPQAEAATVMLNDADFWGWIRELDPLSNDVPGELGSFGWEMT